MGVRACQAAQCRLPRLACHSGAAAGVHGVGPDDRGVAGRRLEGDHMRAVPAQPPRFGLQDQPRPTAGGLVDGQPDAAPGQRHGRTDHDEVQGGVGEHVGVGRRMCAAVHEGFPVDADGPVEPRDGARRGHRIGERRQRSRPNTTRRPSRSRTAHIHSGSDGQVSSGSLAIPAEMRSVPTAPSGSSAASSASGRASNGRAAARASRAAMSAGRRARPLERKTGGLGGGPAPASSRVPAADIGRPSARASRSAAPSPARSDVAVMDPADVPTITVARRGSQPVVSSTAASTPAWNAPPATPPAPSTRPTRGPPVPAPPPVAWPSCAPRAGLMTRGQHRRAACVSSTPPDPGAGARDVSQASGQQPGYGQARHEVRLVAR